MIGISCGTEAEAMKTVEKLMMLSRRSDLLSKGSLEMNIRNVFAVGIALVLFSVALSSAQEYKGYAPESEVKVITNVEGYQQGKMLGKEKTSATKYLLMGGGMGLVTWTGGIPLALLPVPISFVATPYLLSSSKIPNEYYAKAKERGPDYLKSFEAGWKKETRSKKRTYYRWGHGVVPVVLTVLLINAIATSGIGTGA